MKLLGLLIEFMDFICVLERKGKIELYFLYYQDKKRRPKKAAFI
ncbi:hypothetical protein GMMP15_1370033 [Candidatus Magnetomoraceae bacterium gMMP-15]